MSKYGFYERLSKEFPSQVMVDITEVCNLGCIHCTHPMVDEVAKHGKGITKYIRYTSNGEPLVHPKSYEILQYAVDNSGTKVTLTTNGTLLQEKKMKKLLSTGLHMIDVSIDAYSNEIYKKVRVGGDLDVTKKNVLRLLELNDEVGHKTKIIVSFVEQKENSHEIEKFKEFWQKQSVDEVLIRKLHTNSGSVVKENNLEIIKNESRRACLYPWERVVLTAKGTLNFCPTDWYGKSEVSDFAKTSIREVWKNNFYNDLRDQHLTNDYKNEFCKQCPDWKNTSWPFDKNKSYADLVEKILYEEK